MTKRQQSGATEHNSLFKQKEVKSRVYRLVFYQFSQHIGQMTILLGTNFKVHPLLFGQ